MEGALQQGEGKLISEADDESGDSLVLPEDITAGETEAAATAAGTAAAPEGATRVDECALQTPLDSDPDSVSEMNSDTSCSAEGETRIGTETALGRIEVGQTQAAADRSFKGPFHTLGHVWYRQYIEGTQGLPSGLGSVDDGAFVPDQAVSGHQLPWKPKGTRTGSSMRATGSPRKSWACRITTSAAPRPASWT
jgi:hypothetical protein